MALDYALVKRRLEDAVDRVEYLRLGDPFAMVADHVFENAQFAAGQGESTAADLRIAPVEKDLDAGFARLRQIAVPAAGDCGCSGENFAKMNRNVHHVVDTGFEQLQRVLEHLVAAQGNDRSRRPLAHRPRKPSAFIEFAQ